MRRKLVRQGQNALTVTLPAKWTKANGLEAGDEVEIDEEDNRLTIDSAGAGKKLKTASIAIDLEHFNIYRSIIGGLYRGGYDEIKVSYKDAKALAVLQKIIDSLHGLEIFDIRKDSCTVRCVYASETAEVQPHIRKMVHIIKTMQTVINEDIKRNAFNSKQELFQFRSDTLKQRDFVARTIVQMKLLDNKNFPYYNLSFNLWNIARNYYNMYISLMEIKGLRKSNTDLILRTNRFFSEVFDMLENHELVEKHTQYDRIKEGAFRLMKDGKESSLAVAYCLNILMLIQSCNSSILLLNF